MENLGDGIGRLASRTDAPFLSRPFNDLSFPCAGVSDYNTRLNGPTSSRGTTPPSSGSGWSRAYLTYGEIVIEVSSSV